MHADGTLLPRGQFPKRANIVLGTEIELASTLVKFLLDTPAFLLMTLAVFILTFFVAIPNALAGPALHEGVALLTALRTQLGWGPVRVGVLVIFGFRHGAELLSSRRRRCTVLFG